LGGGSVGDHYGDAMESWENCWYWSVREGEKQLRPLEGTYHVKYRFRVKLAELEREAEANLRLEQSAHERDQRTYSKLIDEESEKKSKARGQSHTQSIISIKLLLQTENKGTLPTILQVTVPIMQHCTRL
jgi:hypothetical protein